MRIIITIIKMNAFLEMNFWEFHLIKIIVCVRVSDDEFVSRANPSTDELDVIRVSDEFIRPDDFKQWHAEQYFSVVMQFRHLQR